jgi:hypothetical protein
MYSDGDELLTCASFYEHPLHFTIAGENVLFFLQIFLVFLNKFFPLLDTFLEFRQGSSQQLLFKFRKFAQTEVFLNTVGLETIKYEAILT